ncbi:hypothetical protein [Chryseobacterium sp. EO14]|uniref:hypothetical protein n=1 Tax=Chryseobacterium sp. EO14 TaxID=2950551 RepID=UPI0021092C4B|nr:hypothetical protein [Chryseobacterium sp. EO14]MCQ4139856.1 hypothetical protein [Chryseobacterium sp. EO14]
MSEKEDILEKTKSLYEFSLNSIQEGLKQQIDDLRNFCNSLSNANDEFVNPIFNSNLSTVFLKDIDHKVLLLGYSKDNSDEFNAFKEVFSGLRFLERYEDSFIDKIKYFREKYFKYEEIFFSYNDLFRIYDEYISEHIKNNGKGDSISEDNFLYSYGILIKDCIENNHILKDGLMINRDLFVEKFIIPLEALSKPLVTLDERANSVFIKTNIVLDAKSNMDNFKKSIKSSFEKDIEILEGIKSSIINLTKNNI